MKKNNREDNEFTNFLEIRVIGLMRSGNHAIIDWIQQQYAGHSICFLNNVKHGEIDPYTNYTNISLTGIVEEIDIEALRKQLNENFDKFKQLGFNDKDAAVYGMCENIDDNVGKIRSKVSELGLAENTIIIFMTDNGPNGKRFNGGMRGVKGSIHEGGVRVPCIINWDGKIEARTVANMAGHIDILPTLVSLCNLDPPETLPLDGLDISDLMLDKNAELPKRLFFSKKSREIIIPDGPAVDVDGGGFTPNQDKLGAPMTLPGSTRRLRPTGRRLTAHRYNLLSGTAWPWQAGFGAMMMKLYRTPWQCPCGPAATNPAW